MKRCDDDGRRKILVRLLLLEYINQITTPFQFDEDWNCVKTTIDTLVGNNELPEIDVRKNCEDNIKIMAELWGFDNDTGLLDYLMESNIVLFSTSSFIILFSMLYFEVGSNSF